MNEHRHIAFHIERLVVEIDTPVNSFSLQRCLATALEEAIAERGVPETWQHDGRVERLAVGAHGWDGRGGEAGLARAIAATLVAGLPR